LWLQHLGLKNTKCFNRVDDFMEFYEEHHDKVEGCIVDYYLDDGHLAPDVIKKIREISNSVLIVSVSANFVNDEDVIKTEDMKKALDAGANRVGLKNIDHVENMVMSHLKLRKALPICPRDINAKKEKLDQLFKSWGAI